MGSYSENEYFLAIERIMSNLWFSRIFPRGTMPPSAMDLLLSGMMVSMFMSTICPSPLQWGQYPSGELNEKEWGAGSCRERPESGSTRCLEKCCRTPVSMSITATEPFPRLRAVITLSFILLMSPASGLSLSMTSSMKCALYLSSWVTDASSLISPSILTSVYPLFLICSKSSL